MSLIHDKKAQDARVLFAVIIALVVSGFLTIFAYYFLSEFITAFSATGYYTGKAVEAGEGFLRTLRWFDYSAVLFLMALIIGIIITSYRLASPPIFFVVMLVSGVFYGFVAYFFNYIFQMLVSPSVFTATLAFFPRTVLICKNLHWVMLLEIIVGSIALYAKKPKGQYVA